MKIREFEDIMAFGVGFDSISGDVKGDCVLRTEPELPTVGQGQEVSFFLELITDSAQLAKRLEVSASASLKLGVGGGSAKAKFVSEQKINSYSCFLLVRVVVNNPTKRIRDVRLADTARELLATGKESEFRRRCGDEFLVGITTGGEFIGMIEIESQDETDKKNISAKARASGLTWKASAEFDRAVENITAQRNTKVTLFRKGGTQASIPIELGDMIGQARDFPRLVAGGDAYAYSASFQNYEVLDLPPTANPIDVKQQAYVVERMAAEHMRYQNMLNNIEYVLDHPEQFEQFDRAALNAKADELRGALNKIVESASKCFDNYKMCQLPTALPDLGVLPQRKGAVSGPFQLTDGLLIKGSDDAVYLIEAGERRWITDPQSFDCRQLDWNAIQTIPDVQLSSIRRGPDLPSRVNGTLLKGSGPAVFLMQDCQRRWITSEEVFNSLGLDWTAIQTVPDKDLDVIPRGPDLS